MVYREIDGRYCPICSRVIPCGCSLADRSKASGELAKKVDDVNRGRRSSNDLYKKGK
jgi:hypothetical protein